MIDALAASILISLSSLFGAQSLPDPSSTWKVAGTGWELEKEHPTLTIQANVGDLNCSNGQHLHLPTLVYGSMTVRINEIMLRQFGDPTFNRSNFVFNSPYISCSELPRSGPIEISFFAYSKTYAQLGSWPEITNSRRYEFLYNHSYAAGGFALLFLATFLMFSIFAREERKVAFLSIASCILWAVYQFGTISPVFDVPLSMITVHKISDASLSLGVILFLWALSTQGILSRALVAFSFAVFAMAFCIWATAATGDGVQLGTTMQFPVLLSCSLYCVVTSVRQLIRDKSTRSLLVLLVMLSITLSMASEMLIFLGVGENLGFLPFGMATAFVIFGIIMNSKIEAAYIERDHLRLHFEAEVELKTAELTTALSELKTTQAELIHSAKLASLGTLSAGIAHEINNSLNYVSGALGPLEKLIVKSVPESVLPKISILLSAAKEGLRLTFEVIASLRIYTGMNQSAFKDVLIHEVVNSTLTILRNKTRNKIEVSTDVPTDLTIFGSTVGLNQVLMNLVSNAVDAIPGMGKIEITARRVSSSCVIKITDSGTGISDEIKSRIFDPFYTTKDVGVGTGLGLYIVKNEIDKHKGRISVESQLGVGTTFIIELPVGSISAVPNNAGSI